MGKKLLGLLALVLAAVEVVFMGPAAANVARRVTIAGDLVSFDQHDRVTQWAVRDENGAVIPLGPGYKPPVRDSRGVQVLPGSVVEVDCLLDAATGQCSPMDVATSLLVTKIFKPLALRAEPMFHNMLVMIVDYPQCGLPASLTVEDANDLFVGPRRDGSGGLAQKFAQCSYGRFNLNATAFRAVRVPHMCTTPITTSCAWWSMAALADNATRALIGSVAFSSFTHYTYIVPPGLRDKCPWAGLGLLPGRQTWLQTIDYGVYRWATVMQEMLHNFGSLWHSWKDGIEYEDYSTAMGRGDACPNAAEISRMGWATPSPGGGQINNITLSPRNARTYLLPATYLIGSGSYLRLQPNWLPAYRDPDRAQNLYIAVRVAKGGDAALRAELASKVHIHEVNATMDNGYPEAYGTSDRRIHFIGSVGPRSQLTLEAYKLVVYGGSWIRPNIDILRVHLCRFEVSSDECPSLDSLEPGLSVSSPPSSPPPSAKSPPRQPPSPIRPSPSSPLRSRSPPPRPPPKPSPPLPRPPAPSLPPPSPLPKPPSPRPPVPRQMPSPRSSPPPRPPPAWPPSPIMSPPSPRPSLPPPSLLPPPPALDPIPACLEVPGYRLTPDVFGRGGDIYCDEQLRPRSAAVVCNATLDCKSYNVFMYDGVLWACLKREGYTLIPVRANSSCHYDKIDYPACPPVTGYTVLKDINFGGEAGKCNVLQGVATLAGDCSGNSSCRGFHAWVSASGSSYGCSTSAADEARGLVRTPGVCLYTKAKQDCQVIPGFTLTPGGDHYGDDISCDEVSIEVAAETCLTYDGDDECKAFSTYVIDDVPWACMKYVTGPVITDPLNCFYTKIRYTCPRVPGYMLAPSYEDFGDTPVTFTWSVAETISRCWQDTCKGFHIWYDTFTGTAYVSTTKVPSDVVPALICTYLFNGHFRTDTLLMPLS